MRWSSANTNACCRRRWQADARLAAQNPTNREQSKTAPIRRESLPLDDQSVRRLPLYRGDQHLAKAGNAVARTVIAGYRFDRVAASAKSMGSEGLLRSGCGLSPGSIDRPLAASMRALQGAGGSQEIGRVSRQKGHIVNAPCPNRGEVRLNVRCAGTRTGTLDPKRKLGQAKRGSRKRPLNDWPENR